MEITTLEEQESHNKITNMVNKRESIFGYISCVLGIIQLIILNVALLLKINIFSNIILSMFYVLPPIGLCISIIGMFVINRSKKLSIIGGSVHIFSLAYVVLFFVLIMGGI